MGRIGFTQRALPVIRPVNHVVDGDAVVLRTHGGSALPHNAAVDQVVVCEADQIDPQTRTGWSVVVTGPATRITPPELSRYRQLLVPGSTWTWTTSSASPAASSPAAASIKGDEDMVSDRTRQALMQRRAGQMCQAARAAAVRASVMDTAAAAARLAAQQMRGDNQRMLAAARAGLQKIKNAS